MTELEEGMVKIPFRKDILREVTRIAKEIGVSPSAVIAEGMFRYIDSWDQSVYETREFKYGFEAGYEKGYNEAWDDKEPQEISMFLGDEYAASFQSNICHFARKAWNEEPKKRWRTKNER